MHDQRLYCCSGACGKLIRWMKGLSDVMQVNVVRFLCMIAMRKLLKSAFGHACNAHCR